MRNEVEAKQALDKYSDTVKRICFLHLKNPHDTEDIFQNVFLKYILYSGNFESDEHEKAWIIRVTVNACKDFLKSFSNRNNVSIDVVKSENLAINDDYSELLQIVLSLPSKYKDAIYLFYYENYTVPEIATILSKKENTIYTRLARGRKLLKEYLGGEFYE